MKRQNLGLPKWGILLKRGRQNFELLTVRGRCIEFLDWVNIRNKLNPTKNGVQKWGVPAKRGPSIIQSF